MRTDDCPIQNGLLFQIWYPFDMEKYYWVCQWFDRSTVFCVMLFFCYYKIVPISLMIFILGQIKILQHYVKTIDQKYRRDESFEGGVRNNVGILIKDCLRKHQEVIR